MDVLPYLYLDRKSFCYLTYFEQNEKLSGNGELFSFKPETNEISANRNQSFIQHVFVLLPFRAEGLYFARL